MPNRNHKEEHLVDLSARSRLKFSTASQYDVEQNRKSFEELNASIERDRQAYNSDLGAYIAELEKKRENELKSHSYKFNTMLGASCLLGLMVLVVSYFKFEYGDGSFFIESKQTEIIQPFYGSGNELEALKIEATNDFAESIPISYELAGNTYNNKLTTLKNEIVGRDASTGEEFFLEQLSGKKLLIPYNENGKEVYFLGECSNNCNWDGYCITNTYNPDGTLYGICEYKYEDGVCLECKSVYNSNTYGEWIYINLKYEDEAYGESIRYSFVYADCKKFDDTNVEITDILYLDDLLNEIESTILSYYKGKISNGRYNDLSGEAYLITYFEPNSFENITDPVIKTLYKGKFVNGDFFEENYDSWYITRDINTTYMYYKGGFLDGNVNHKDKSKEVFENNLTHVKIDEYLDEYGLSIYSDQFVTEYENKDDLSR